MPFYPDQIFAHAEELLRRVSPEGRERARRARERRRQRALRAMLRMAIATVAVVIGFTLFGALVAPLGAFGFLAMLLAIVASWVIVGVLSREPEVTSERLGEGEVKLLPQRTERWLEAQRPALPAPAHRLLDGIGVRLDALTPQLAEVPNNDPAAAEVRKLLCDDLPGLVSGYRRVPAALRRSPGDGGQSPDAQLLDGLQVIDGQIARLTETLAADDLQRLATQGRYLELKYKNDDDGVGALKG